MAKLACLVLAYGGAPVLARSLPFLREAGWDVFVHLDRKVDRAQYSSGLDASACTFLDDPYEVFWGGFAMVRAELLLLNVARAAGPYEKYLLISDDSFPVLPPAQLAAHFDNPHDQVTVVRQRIDSLFHQRYINFFCYDHQTTTARPFGPRSGAIDEDLERRMAEIAVLRRIGKKPLQVYFGSQFWALTPESVELVTRTAENDLQLVKSFEYAALPDELMIQSILGNYKFQRNQQTGPVYADFSVQSPRIFSTMASLPLDFQPPHVFVRKISPKAPEMLEQMSAHLQAGRTIHGLHPQQHQARASSASIVGDSLLCRLAAPGPDCVPDPAWHAVESVNGRTYRWTALEQVTWQLAGLPEHRGKIRFFITMVVGTRPEFRQQCRLTFAGQTLPLELQEGNLTAEFPYSGSSETTVVLTTHTPKSPGNADVRKLGLSIAT